MHGLKYKVAVFKTGSAKQDHTDLIVFYPHKIKERSLFTLSRVKIPPTPSSEQPLQFPGSGTSLIRNER
jgi:hypothetical protein